MTLAPVLAAAAAAALAAAAYALGLTVARRGARRELERTRDQLDRRLSELAGLGELGLDLSESLDTRHVAGRVARFINLALQADGTLVALASADRSHLEVVAGEGRLAGAVGQVIPEADPGALVRAMGQERLVGTSGRRGGGAIPPAAIDAVAPLHAHGKTLGAVAVAAPAGREGLASDGERLLVAVAAHAAAVLANATLVERLRDGAEEWEAAFDAITDGIAVLDDRHRIRRVNRAMADLARRGTEDLTGAHLCETLYGPDSQLHALMGYAPMETHRTVTARSATPRERVLRATAAPMRGGRSRDGWKVVLIEDVTEWQALQSRLIQNERMVAVGQLVSGVAHELNNPLTSIAGLAEFLLSKSTRRHRSHEHLTVIQAQAARAKKIVGNLLEFARKGPAEITEFDLTDLAQQVTRLMGPELKLRHIELETDLAEHLPPVLGDQHQIQQVVINLLTNAVQAAEANRDTTPPRVRLTTGSDADHLVLRVSDSGSGIPRGDVPNLFTPFFTTKEAGKGTGLGLSIAFGIVRDHRGSITVEATGAEGTTFRVDLPAHRATAASEGGRRTSAPPTEAQLSLGPATGRILLVDADPAVRRMIKALVSDARRDLDEVSSGTEALELLAAHAGDYGLIIADARSAATPGETLADRLVRDFAGLRDKTILITADVRPETSRWLDGLQCRHFHKPFNVRDFLGAVDEILGARAPR